MAKKGSAPAAPDYSSLISASEKSAEYSYKTAQDQLEWAKKTYPDNKVVGDQVIDFALGQMDKESAWADIDRKRYEDIYQPLEEQAALRAQDYATPERQDGDAGKAGADDAMHAEQGRQAAQERLKSFGVDPSQLKSGALDLSTRVAEGAMQAGAGTTARFRTEQYADQLVANAINTGKGYPQQTLAASGQAGTSGNQASNTGLATTTSGANTMGTGYQWQGAGNREPGLAGQLQNASYQNQLAGYQAKQSGSSGWGSAAGIAASVLPMLIQEGGAIPDEGSYVPPQASPSNGAIPDDVPAQIAESGQPARLNAGE